MEKLKNRIKAVDKRKIMMIFVMCFIVMAQFVALELSKDLYSDEEFISNFRWFIYYKPAFMLVELATVLLFDMVFIVLFKARIGMIVATTLTMALSMTNYFVSLWHGSPFTLNLLRNTKTALNVISAYKFTLSKRLLVIVIINVVIICASIFLMDRAFLSRKVSIIACAMLSVVMVFSFAIPKSIVPHGVVYWSWREALYDYGYINCFVQQTVAGFKTCVKPDKYNEKELKSYVESYTVSKDVNNKPDVILILNETFFDLSKIVEIKNDKDCMGNINNLDNCITGYTVVPQIGGGTNKSEYEYLTSNSLQQSPLRTPFTGMNMAGAKSVVTHLKELGYDTLAAHTEIGQNYNRQYSYPALGFDKSYFDTDFENLEKLGERWFATDESAYDNLIRWYDEMDDGPRFMYLLTIQNHGSYEWLNEDELTVHTENDFKELTHSVNEFETCISKSDEAFIQLTDYFDSVDRDVIVCMIGDHGPAFIEDIADKQGKTKEELDMDLRSTPYIIWSNNIDLTDVEIPKTMSVPFMVPTVLDIADINMSGYYDFMIKLRDKVPVVTAYGYCESYDGDINSYDDEYKYKDMVDIYLGMSYANMKDEKFMQDFVLPINNR